MFQYVAVLVIFIIFFGKTLLLKYRVHLL